MSDENIHRIFETAGTVAYMVAESWLVAYRIVGSELRAMAKVRLYDTGHGPEAVEEFLKEEAALFQVGYFGRPVLVAAP